MRRTVSLEVTPKPAWTSGLRIAASARDLLVGVDGTRRVLGSRSLAVRLDARSRITGVEGDLSASLVDGLLGASAVSGFRGKLAGLAGLDPVSLESALLDDLPTVRLISGYAMLMELPPGTQLPGGRSPMVGVCTGWAEGATADRRARAGGSLLAGAPPATLTPSPGDFHAESSPRPNSMRRRRILDLTRMPEGFDVFEYFRDSHFDAELSEGSLHEYVVRARIAADGTTVEDLNAEPMALPFPECPLAAPNTRDLIGTSLGEVTGTVKTRLIGTRSCTHLNDVVRFLCYVPSLSTQVPGA